MRSSPRFAAALVLCTSCSFVAMRLPDLPTDHGQCSVGPVIIDGVAMIVAVVAAVAVALAPTRCIDPLGCAGERAANALQLEAAISVAAGTGGAVAYGIAVATKCSKVRRQQAERVNDDDERAAMASDAARVGDCHTAVELARELPDDLRTPAVDACFAQLAH